MWIRRVLLGDPPPAPPAAGPNLASADPGLGLLPLKRQLEQHVDNAACAHCHASIDPWGLALEEFDAVGLRRQSVLRRSGEIEESHLVDASATLPDGHAVNGIDDLTEYLLSTRRSQFARSLVSKLLSYALGRSLGPGDTETVDDLASRFEQSGYRFRELCAIIVTSNSFRKR